MLYKGYSTVQALDDLVRGMPEGSVPCGPDIDRSREGDFFIDNLLVRIHCVIEMIEWTGLAPWEF